MKEDIELLEQYLAGTLEAGERARLEARLGQEPELVKELHELQTLIDGIGKAGRTDVLTSLRELEWTLPALESQVVPFWGSAWVRVAASVSVLAVCAYLFWPRPEDPQRLFAQYFEPYPNVIMPTVRGDVDTTLLERAYRAYDHGKFDDAIDFFRRAGQDDAAVYLYLGNSYLATGDAENAIPLFEKVISEYDAFDDQAAWYLALGYLKNGNKGEAVKIFARISEGRSSHAASAKKILSDLTQ